MKVKQPEPATLARRDRLYAELVRIAARGEVCPDNTGLGLRVGANRGAITSDISVLRAAGAIVCGRSDNYTRVITITATGASTMAPHSEERRKASARKRGGFAGGVALRARARAAGKSLAQYVADGGPPALSNADLYGDLASDVTLLRQRGFHVTRDGERFQVGSRILDADGTRAMAARERRLLTAKIAYPAMP